MPDTHMLVACPDCFGSGKFLEFPCRGCDGTGKVTLAVNRALTAARCRVALDAGEEKHD